MRVLFASQKAEDGETFRFVNDNLAYQTSNLYRLLLLELLSIDRDHLRKCARPDCPNPYFVAARWKQIYCSEPCAVWAQKASKRKWWSEKGDPERRRRAALGRRKVRQTGK